MNRGNVVARQAEDVGDGLGGDLGGVARDEVDLSVPQPVADEALRGDADPGAQAFDQAGREGAGEGRAAPAVDRAVGGEHAVREDVEQRALGDRARFRIERLRRLGAGVAHQQIDVAGAEDQDARDLVADEGQPGPPRPEHAVRVGLELRHRQRRDIGRGAGRPGLSGQIVGRIHPEILAAVLRENSRKPELQDDCGSLADDYSHNIRRSGGPGTHAPALCGRARRAPRVWCVRCSEIMP
ncbi:hypothetical protein ABIC20_005814 [Methylobacterium radiotolerans]|uniref:Uncharacterized protein n=1 Tax=Methylobacterium radiotolerans TaxID=31998 RepID=A0ABV2NPR7_9HYPH